MVSNSSRSELGSGYEEKARTTEKPVTTLLEDVTGAGLEKVYARHGRIDLIPMPSDDPNDPYNWASWRKNLLLFQVAFHAMMGPFSAAAVVPSFVTFAREFDVTITQTTYLVSVPIIFLGTFPLLWAPVSSRIGRRPIFLASTLISAGMHLASAYCNSYGTLMVTRALQAVFLSPPQSIGAQTVNEMFFEHERGQKLGIWALLITLGPPLGPLVMGFVVYHLNWRWSFNLLAIINLMEFVLYLFFGPETLFDRRDRNAVRDITGASATEESKSASYTPYITFRRWSSTPWSQLPLQIVRPMALITSLPVVCCALAYAISFSYTNVLLTVEIPSLLGRKYELDAQQVGLQFIAPLLGAIIGEPLAGWGSDKFIAYRTKRANGNREPEMRLPFALPGFLIAAAGILVFGIQLEKTKAGVWSVTPIIGSGIALFGLQLVTTVCFTYAIESQPASRAPLVPLFVSLVRQTYAFTAPFYLNVLFENLGGTKAGGVLASLVGGVGFLLVLACLVYGRRWREKAL